MTQLGLCSRNLFALLLILLEAGPVVAEMGPPSSSCLADSVSTCNNEINNGTNSSFGAEAYQHGLRLQLVDAAQRTEPTGKILVDTVLYGRPIVRLPLRAVLQVGMVTDSVSHKELLHCIGDSPFGTVDNSSGQKALGNEPQNVQDLVGLALLLLLEVRNASSVFHPWLSALSNDSESVPSLSMSERQRKAVKGTTVEAFCEEMLWIRELIRQAAHQCLGRFGGSTVTQMEARWALAVVLRHAHHILPNSRSSSENKERIALIPLLDLLSAKRHPDPTVAIVFHDDWWVNGDVRDDCVTQRAPRDMKKGEEVFFWTGRMSSSEAAMRFGVHFSSNPTGVGGNVSKPPNWSGNRQVPNFREFAKFNCTSLRVFEMRFSPKGWPNRMFVRCSRIAWHMEHGWYSPEYVNRVQELDKWPPPPKYNHQDWLSWTQADRQINQKILDYCRAMKRQLKESISAATAADFRASKDQRDNLIWQVRVDETKAFQKCVDLAKTLSIDLAA